MAAAAGLPAAGRRVVARAAAGRAQAAAQRPAAQPEPVPAPQNSAPSARVRSRAARPVTVNPAPRGWPAAINTRSPPKRACLRSTPVSARSLAPAAARWTAVTARRIVREQSVAPSCRGRICTVSPERHANRAAIRPPNRSCARRTPIVRRKNARQLARLSHSASKGACWPQSGCLRSGSAGASPRIRVCASLLPLTLKQ